MCVTQIPESFSKGFFREKNVSPTTLHYHHHTTITTLPSPHSNHHYHHHTSITTTIPTLPSPQHHHITSSIKFSYFLGWGGFRRLARAPFCGDRACRSAPAVRFCACGFVSAHPLRGSCVSERSRCAFLRMWICPRAPLRRSCVGALPLCVFAHVDLCLRTLCGNCACRSASAVRFCACHNLLRTPSVGALPLCVFAHFTTCFAHPLRASCVSERCRCAFLRMWICFRAPSAGIVRVGALRCAFLRMWICPARLCKDRACRSAPAVRFCACGFVLAHPLRGLCVSERFRCAFLRMLQLASYTLCRSASAVRFRTFYNLLRTPSAGIVRVGALPLCVFAYFKAWSCTLCGDRACRSLSHKCSTPRTPGAAVAGKSTFCSTNVVRRGRQELPQLESQLFVVQTYL